MKEKSKIYAESWNVAWRKCSDKNSILNDKKSPFTFIKNSIRYWAADPFLFEHNGDIYIFAELYDYFKRRGVIGFYKLNGKKRGKWISVISEDYHLSYPYIFKKDGQIYIMPESNASNSLYLYRAVNFPYEWEKAIAIRENVKLADTTLFDFNNKEYALSFDVTFPKKPNLMLLDMKEKNNDKILDLENVELRRPAGKVLPDNIRPAQNCTSDYGKGIIFYHYSLKDDEYSEEEIQRVFPEDLSYSQEIYLDGMHTYNRLDKYEVIDVKTRRFNLLNLASRIIGKL